MTQLNNHPLVMSDSLFKKLLKIKDKSLVANLILNGDSTLFVLDGIHHITYRDAESLFSYCPKGKIQEISCEGRWILTGRQSAKIGRLPKMIFKENLFSEGMITDKDIEDFVNEIKIIYTDGANENFFELVNGRDIWKYYQTTHYYSDGSCECNDSALHGSCMRGCEDVMFELYTENPEKVSMVVLFNSKQKVLGRALLWKLDCGETYMDRVYACAERYYKMFYNYASDNNWFRYGCDKSLQNKAYRPGQDARKSPVDLRLDVTFSKPFSPDEIPYLDTFRYVATNDEGLVISAHGGLNNENVRRYCRETNGSWCNYQAHKAHDTGAIGFNCQVEESEPRLLQIQVGKYQGKYFEHAEFAYYKHNGNWGNYALPKEETFIDEFSEEFHHISHLRQNENGKKYSERYEITTLSGYTTSRHDEDICILKKSNFAVYSSEPKYELRSLCSYDGYGWRLKTKDELEADKNKPKQEQVSSCSDFRTIEHRGCDASPSRITRAFIIDEDERPLPF